MRTKKINIDDFQFDDPKEITTPEINEKVIEEGETQPFEVLKTFHTPYIGYMKGRRLECVVCGKKDYNAYELVGIKLEKGNLKHRQNLVCFDCLIKNNYIKRYVRGEWKWIKNERQVKE